MSFRKLYRVNLNNIESFIVMLENYRPTALREYTIVTPGNYTLIEHKATYDFVKSGNDYLRIYFPAFGSRACVLLYNFTSYTVISRDDNGYYSESVNDCVYDVNPDVLNRLINSGVVGFTGKYGV